MSRKTPTHGYAWGYNNMGGLGIGNAARAMTPVPVELPAGTADVQGGSDFAVALTATGRVWTWGGNRYGQLGDGTDRSRFVPQQILIPGDAQIAAISAGADHVLALSHSGSVFCWGRNTHGQLGDGTTTDRRQPAKVAATGIVQLATGVASSHAITSNGSLLSWGRPVGESAGVSAGDGSMPAAFSLPAKTKARMVDAGQRHVVVLTQDGQLLTFGVDPGGRPLPSSVPIDRSWGRVTSISAGDNHTVALTNSGVVLAWGANYYGQLGTRDTKNRDVPIVVRIPAVRGRVVELVASGNSVLARTDKADVYSWGHGKFGQNGNGLSTDQTRPIPVKIPHQPAVTAVRTGRYHNVVLANGSC